MVESIQPVNETVAEPIQSAQSQEGQSQESHTAPLVRVPDDTPVPEDRQVAIPADAPAKTYLGPQPGFVLDPAKVLAKQQEQAEIIEDGELFIETQLEAEAHAIIEIKTELYNVVAKDFSCQVGKVESRKERNERGLKDINLTYGEIEFKSFFQVFKWIQKTFKDKDPDCWHNAFNNAGGTFVDLGHGTGKGILAGAFMHQFERCWGIEILESLQNVSINLKAVYDTYLTEVEAEQYEQVFGWPVAQAPRFEVVLGDIFAFEWHDADMIFCNSTCFNATMMEQIFQKTLKCKKGTWFVTMSKRLPHVEKIPEGQDAPEGLHWEFILAIKLQMSWGKATVNVQRKISHPVAE